METLVQAPVPAPWHPGPSVLLPWASRRKETRAGGLYAPARSGVWLWPLPVAVHAAGRCRGRGSGGGELLDLIYAGS